MIREGDLDDALRRESVRAQRDARRHPVGAGAAAVAPTGRCCDAWAATAGAEHAQTCRRHAQRKNAAWPGRQPVTGPADDLIAGRA